MKNLITALFIFASIVAFSQTDTTVVDSNRTEEETYVEPKKQQRTPDQKKSAMPFIKKLYFGGSFGANFGTDYTSITIAPEIGYAIKPSLYTGLKFYYTYSKQSVRIFSKNEEFKYNNYGVGTFLRWYAFKDIFLHVAPEMMSFQYNSVASNGDVTESREWVPFVWAGAGYRKMMGKRSWFSAHVLFDLIQDKNSPYEQWEPIIVMGAGTSF